MTASDVVSLAVTVKWLAASGMGVPDARRQRRG